MSSADHIHFVSFWKVDGLTAKKWQLATGFLAEDCNMLECVFKIVQYPAKSSSPDSAKAILFQGTLTHGVRAKSKCHRSTAGNLNRFEKELPALCNSLMTTLLPSVSKRCGRGLSELSAC